jgi:predicted DNA-binding protein (MmcQ/YjbR family)
MNIEEFREYCLSKPLTTEHTPFGPNTLVIKVGGKMFALANMVEFNSFNVKCDPEIAVELRENHEAVIPGYHMNKKHWNTIYVDRDLNGNELRKWINHSYELVFKSLPAKSKNNLTH